MRVKKASGEVCEVFATIDAVDDDGNDVRHYWITGAAGVECLSVAEVEVVPEVPS